MTVTVCDGKCEVLRCFQWNCGLPCRYDLLRGTGGNSPGASGQPCPGKNAAIAPRPGRAPAKDYF